jgi:hypothetical protein
MHARVERGGGGVDAATQSEGVVVFVQKVVVKFAVSR